MGRPPRNAGSRAPAKTCQDRQRRSVLAAASTRRAPDSAFRMWSIERCGAASTTSSNSGRALRKDRRRTEPQSLAFGRARSAAKPRARMIASAEAREQSCATPTPPAPRRSTALADRRQGGRPRARKRSKLAGRSARERVGIGPVLKEEEAVLVFDVAMDGVQQASRLLPRTVDVLETQLEHAIEVFRAGANTAGHDEHRGNLPT